MRPGRGCQDAGLEMSYPRVLGPRPLLRGHPSHSFSLEWTRGLRGLGGPVGPNTLASGGPFFHKNTEITSYNGASPGPDVRPSWPPRQSAGSRPTQQAGQLCARHPVRTRPAALTQPLGPTGHQSLQGKQFLAEFCPPCVSAGPGAGCYPRPAHQSYRVPQGGSMTPGQAEAPGRGHLPGWPWLPRRREGTDGGTDRPFICSEWLTVAVVAQGEGDGALTPGTCTERGTRRRCPDARPLCAPSSQGDPETQWPQHPGACQTSCLWPPFLVRQSLPGILLECGPPSPGPRTAADLNFLEDSDLEPIVTLCS